MKTRVWKWAALAAATAAWACGGGDSLPGKDGESPGPSVQVPAEKSTWPLTKGSWWVYTITETDGRTWQKQVVVDGAESVPGTSPAVQAVKVRSLQPQIDFEERSWQLERDGLVVRVREEDFKQGALASVSTWDPVPLKALARAQAVGWSHTQDSRETVTEAGVTETKTRTYTWRVVAVDETVTTKAGTFTNAIKVQRDRVDTDKAPRVYWLVPGVGKVREEGERTEVLEQFFVAP